MIQLLPSPVVHLELHTGNLALEPREGAAGCRSVVRVPEGGEIAFWQSKTRTDGR